MKMPIVMSISVALVFAACSGGGQTADSSTVATNPAPAPLVPAESATPEPPEVEDPCVGFGNLLILKEEDNCIDPWPLTSSSGILYCDPFNEGVKAVVYQPDEELSALGVTPEPGVRASYFAVNGMASSVRYQEIDPIWKDNTASIGGPKVNIGALIDAGLALCK